ncbi:MAG: sensor histidine kinase [Acidobacteria bacterium]|nr:sensor histidine kinase [Acidobacteriota bacterium]
MRIESGNPPAGGKRRRPSWPILALGFGGLLLCILATAVGTLVFLRRVSDEQTQSRKAFLSRLQALDQIRSAIYLSGAYVRDVLLAPDTQSAREEVDHLARLRNENRAAIVAYAQRLEPEETEPFNALRNEIDAYWKVLDATVAWTPGERQRLRYAFFYEELIPRRTAMLQIADRITSVHERGLSRSEAQSAASAASLRRTLLATFVFSLLGGVILAALTIGSTLRLERELDDRSADLQKLSTLLLRSQEDERRALARELHDEVGQSLSAVLLETESAECENPPPRLREHLTAIRTLAEKTIAQVRDLALLLRPSMLDDLGLAPALNWHARETTKRTGRTVVVSADKGIDDLPDEHRTCVYRVVQEAVNNAVRHAKARTVNVSVRQEPGAVKVTVEDDGAGFDARFTHGLGLLGMEERVRRLGGKLSIDSEPGRGARIQAVLPVAALNRQNELEPDSHLVG